MLSLMTWDPKIPSHSPRVSDILMNDLIQGDSGTAPKVTLPFSVLQRVNAFRFRMLMSIVLNYGSSHKSQVMIFSGCVNKMVNVDWTKSRFGLARKDMCVLSQKPRYV